jgi:hypothetical protein
MDSQPPYHGLQVGEDMRQQRREWAVQHVAWVLLYALLAAVILGAVGKGLLSEASVGSLQDDGLRVEYERFMRHRSPDTLRLLAMPASDTVSVVFDTDYVDRLDIQKVSPQPERVKAGARTMTFVFHAVPREPVRIAFDIQPDEVGMLRGWVALQGQPRLGFSHFVYP